MNCILTELHIIGYAGGFLADKLNCILTIHSAPVLTPHSQKYMKFCREVCLQWNGIVINQRSAKYRVGLFPFIMSQDGCFKKSAIHREHSVTDCHWFSLDVTEWVLPKKSPVKHSTTGCAVDQVVAHLVRLPVPRLTFIGA